MKRLLAIFALCCAATCFCSAQIGGSGWGAAPVTFNVQWPYNVPESSRYTLSNGVYHCLVYSNDAPFKAGNTTMPRTEQRFTPDYTNGEIQYQATMMAPSNENSYCVFQIHSGDAQSPTYGSTTFMLFWFSSDGGSVHDYSGTELAKNLGNQWFQLNVDHNVATRTIKVWINRQLVWTQQDNGAGDFYMKDGVYVQNHSPTLQMDTWITNNIQMWTNSGTNSNLLLWNGGGGADMNWSTIRNWTNVTAGGYGPPGPNDSVLFTNSGATAAEGAVDNQVDASMSILSLQYGQTANCHTTQVAPGQTLTIATNLTVGTGTDLGAAGILSAAITGGGGGLAITNTNCLVVVRQGTATGSGPWSQRATLDLSGLGTFNAGLGRLLVAGDGGSSAFNSREVGTLYLAKTNLITVWGAAPAIDIAENSANGPGANADPALLASYLYLGVTNAIFADSLAVGRSKSAGTLAFNPLFTNGLSPSLYLRGLSASRTEMVSVGDESALGSSNQRSAGTADLSGGSVDALIGTLYVGRSMNGANTGTGVSATGTLAFSAGTVDVDTLNIGCQTSLTGTGPGAAGTVNVNGAGVLTVNQAIVLAAGNASSPPVRGDLNLDGGTVQTTNILGGGGVSTINLNSGKLDLQFGQPAPGRIAMVSTLNVGSVAATDPAVLANAGAIAVSNAIVIAPNGILAGNTLITAPALTVNGALSPGAIGAGWITNNGPVTFGAGGSYLVTVQDAFAGPVAGWSFIEATAGINIQAIGGNPFTLALQTPGPAANFDYHTNFDWVVATAEDGITNFNTASFAVDDSLFDNDLAGGYFFVRSNNKSLILSFTNNHPPVAAAATFYRTGHVTVIPLASLAAYWSDPDGDAIGLAGIKSDSTSGANNVAADNSFIYYTNANNAADAILYSVQDIRTNPPAVYRPGDTVQTGAGVINIVPPPSIRAGLPGPNSIVLSGHGGIPNRAYWVLTSTNLALPIANWAIAATNLFDGNGDFQLTNAFNPDLPQQLYLLRLL
jgi:hypothetical protein